MNENDELAENFREILRIFIRVIIQLFSDRQKNRKHFQFILYVNQI